MVAGRMIVALLALVASSPAFSAQPCKEMADVKGMFPADTTFTNITAGQFHFAEGIFIGNAPGWPELPTVSSAMLATPPDSKGGGVVLFMEGGKVCFPMGLPKEGIDLLMGILTGGVDKEGNEL